ncbi:hypothetical protein MRB53_031924 [Persea americana]|uniref:Uncharacterized protein n=1 Tax=Persea americana TaxID=3435 RepID=A0ACC2KQU0_PERAE|nr:hypothetical protein MRB53_031924 [Persea americana]
MLPLLLSALLLWMMMPQALSDAVLDTDGQTLKAWTTYYVLPGVHGQGGGGLTLRTRNGKCLMYVAQDESNTSSGTQAFFRPVNSTGSAIIKVSMDVKIAFLGEHKCKNSTVGDLDYLDGPMGNMYMRAGLVDVWFKIEKDGDYYKLQSCLSDSSKGWAVACGNVGVLVEDGKRWLAWSYEALPVVFKKV